MLLGESVLDETQIVGGASELDGDRLLVDREIGAGVDKLAELRAGGLVLVAAITRRSLPTSICECLPARPASPPKWRCAWNLCATFMLACGRISRRTTIWPRHGATTLCPDNYLTRKEGSTLNGFA